MLLVVLLWLLLLPYGYVYSISKAIASNIELLVCCLRPCISNRRSWSPVAQPGLVPQVYFLTEHLICNRGIIHVYIKISKFHFVLLQVFIYMLCLYINIPEKKMFDFLNQCIQDSVLIWKVNKSYHLKTAKIRLLKSVTYKLRGANKILLKFN